MTDRRTGSVGVTVDLDRRPGITLNRQVGGLGVTVDLKIILGRTVTASQGTSVALSFTVTPGGNQYPITRAVSVATGVALQYDVQYPSTILLTRAVTQATAVTRSYTVIPGNLVTVTASQAQSVTLAPRATTLMRRVTQPTQVGLRGGSSRTLAITVGTTARLSSRWLLTRAVTVGQSATSIVGKGYQRTVTVTQSMATSLVKSVRLMRRLTGTNRVQTSVSLRGSPNRLVRVTQATAARLVKRIILAPRTVTQAQSVSRSGIPVDLILVSTVQARSLALGRAISLTRTITQGALAVLPRSAALAPTVQVRTVATRLLAEDLTRAIAQEQAVSLEVDDVTPRTFLIVTASVSQQVALSQSSTGQSARTFDLGERETTFVTTSRDHRFTPAGRRARFTVEVR